MARVCERCGYENTDEAKFCLQCGAMLEQQAPAAEDQDPLIGKIIMGRYRVLRLLGEGGMGKVFLAEQKMGTATRKVAIKTLHSELSGDPQLVARFHRECETVIELHHPNTVQFFDFGDLEDKTLFIVMEFIEGEDLAHRLQREGAISSQLADKLLIQICGSLNEAHDRGIVHRDLKPENVLLTHRGGQTDFVKVLDFGIAKRDEADNQAQAKLTKQGMVLGTPPYMSPEQFSGQLLDARSDIYSLGVMTYEMLTGTLPFEANTPWEWATKHLTEQPRPLNAHPAAAQLPPNKVNAVMRALAKNRDDRQPNVLAFMHEFTGMGDAQAAWTMATGVGVSGTTPAPGTSPPGTHPLGTPQPMAQTGGHTPVPGHGPTGVAGGGYPTPQPGGMATPAPG
ncbi:MAG: protein kinase [Myxococcota bacterium]